MQLAIAQAVHEVFSQYFRERKTIIVTTETMLSADLNGFFSKSFAELRICDGSLYCRNSL